MAAWGSWFGTSAWHSSSLPFSRQPSPRLSSVLMQLGASSFRAATCSTLYSVGDTGLPLAVKLPLSPWATRPFPLHPDRGCSHRLAAALPAVEQRAKAIMDSEIWPLCSSFLSLPCLALADVAGHFRVVINNNKSTESIRAGYFLPPLGLEGYVFFQIFQLLVKGSCHMGTVG